MKMVSQRAGGWLVVSVRGSADTSAAATLREALVGAIDGGDTRLVCDLDQTDFICSDVLGVLITTHLKARARGGFLRLAGPQPHLRDILQTTRLDQLFEVFPDVASAVSAGH